MIRGSKPDGLARFVAAQDPVYDDVVAELAAGRKRSHWMWFVFPQLAGLGRSDMAQRYAITGLSEARAYLAHPVLGPRLVACADALLALGADDAVNHSAVDVGREIRARTARRGVDVVVDSVGEATWSQSLGALGRRGRIVTCGGTSGPTITTDVRKLFWNQWTILGSTMGSESEFEAIVAHFNDGRLRPPIDHVYDLTDARLAYERLASGEQFGKVVVRMP